MTSPRPSSFTVRSDAPLLSVIDEENGEEVTRYFPDEPAAEAVVTEADTRAALNAIGAWADLDWEETISELERIRHESKPTPPIDDLLDDR